MRTAGQLAAPTINVPISENGSEVASRKKKETGEEAAPTVDPRNQLNELTAKEWIPETISVWNQRGLGAGHPYGARARLSPFVVVGSTVKACALDGRNGIGSELNPEFADLCRERLQAETDQLDDNVSQSILEGDVREQLPSIADESIDFVVTSPPYWSILKKEDHKARQERIEKGLMTDYGSDPRDLGNISDYSDFLAELAGIFGECARTLKHGGYMAIIVSDFRDKSKYIMFHADLAQTLAEYGLEMKGLKTLYQRHKKVFPYGYPYSYVPNIHNQFILILQKPKRK